MPSPFHQKYASQTHKYFAGKYDTMPSIPDAPNKDAERRESDASSVDAPASPTDRRRSSTQRYANLEAMKRPTDDESVKKRASYQDARIGTPGFLGQWWNNFTRGPMANEPLPQKPKDIPDVRDTSTLRQ
jgi:hypothetical protein